jgi:hypothetical protein
VKDAGAAGAVRAARATGRPNEREVGGSTQRDSRDRLWTQDAVIFSAPGRRRSPVLRPRQGTFAMRRRGPVAEGSRVSGIRQRGGTIDNGSCGWNQKHPS